ncbi:hypothetical protein [Lactobacillus terrae]|uniref:hypothetical protein n=1 Tax=Lactobacillus terrae TaxID=2269374 RepID=UPI000C1B6C9B|nr:hypothetical protein [Lactobacillus terrae]
MKKYLLIGLSLSMFFILFLSNGVSAATINPSVTEDMNFPSDVNIVYTRDKIVPVYDHNGNLIKNFAVSANSAWYTDKIITFLDSNNNLSEYYRVCTDGYVNIDDIDLTSPNGALVSVVDSYRVFDSENKIILGGVSSVVAGTVWKAGDVIRFIDQYGQPDRTVYRNLVQITNGVYVPVGEHLYGNTIINK